MKKGKISGIKNLLNAHGAFAALLLIIVAASFIYSDFMTYTNISNVFRQVSAKGIVAVGMTFVILTRGIDLSVGSSVALSGILAAMFSDGHPVLMIAVPLLTGILIGLINGFCIAKLKIAPFIVTLSLMMAARGVVYIVSDEHTMPYGEAGDGLSKFVNADFLGIPVLTIFFLVCLFVAMAAASRTRFGRNIYAVGGNEDAANLMGIPVDRVKILAYVICGFCSALGGLLLSARLGSGQPYVANAWEMDAIAAVAIGGTSLAGGVGKFSGTFAGVMIVGLVSNIINLQGTLSSWCQNIITGGLLGAVVVVQSQIRTHIERTKRKGETA